MRVAIFLCVAAAAATMPVAVHADDPNDPTMRSAAARARDKAIIRQLNLDELARVRKRDAGYAEGWRAAREGNAARSQDHQRAMADYARKRDQYERDMAAWRRAVAACRAGDYSACDD
jgi:predicted acylesterase/phospholipase RssA